MLTCEKGLCYIPRTPKDYIVTDEQRSLEVSVGDTHQNVFVSLSPVGTFVDLPECSLEHLPRGRTLPSLPIELSLRILEEAVLLRLSELDFKQAARMAVEIHPFLTRRLYRRFIHPDAPTRKLVAASRLTKTIALLAAIWEFYFAANEPRPPHLAKLGLFYISRAPKIRFRHPPSPPAPYLFVDDDRVLINSQIVNWIQDCADHYDIPTVTQIGPFCKNRICGDVAVLTHIKRDTFFVQAVLVNPFFCFDLWVWCRRMHLFKRLDYSTEDLYKDEAWRRFFGLCTVAFSDKFGTMCMPGYAPEDALREQAVLAYDRPKWVDLRQEL